MTPTELAALEDDFARRIDAIVEDALAPVRKASADVTAHAQTLSRELDRIYSWLEAILTADDIGSARAMAAIAQMPGKWPPGNGAKR